MNTTARIIKVIHTMSCEGSGSQTDPHRTVDRYFNRDGELIAEIDPGAPATVTERIPNKLRDLLIRTYEFLLNGTSAHSVNEERKTGNHAELLHDAINSYLNPTKSQ